METAVHINTLEWGCTPHFIVIIFFFLRNEGYTHTSVSPCLLCIQKRYRVAKEAYESLLQTENLPTQVKAATLQQLGKSTSLLKLLKLVTTICILFIVSDNACSCFTL